MKSSYYIPAASPQVGWMSDAVQEATGVPAELSGVGWLGDTASFGHLVPTVIFGPGREPIYSANEWLDITDIHTSVRVYAGTMVRALAAAGA